MHDLRAYRTRRVRLSASIVIPVFNGAGLTVRCVEHILRRRPRVDFEIIVVDDASTDGTIDALASRFPGDLVRVVRREHNGGFAAACNLGATRAHGEFVVFLNNDTEPLSGWLDALVDHALRHPRAAVVGSKLLFPNDTIQHAGVVFCQDGHPRHLYAGVEATLPAIQRSRRFQAVTAACALVRRSLFIEVGGFDEAYRNGMEDVDLCLRLGELGHEVHYCHDSVLYHLESVSRGRSGPEIKDGIRRFQERWGGKVRRDDVDYYLADGLLRVEYRDTYPLRMAVSPLLAGLDLEGRAGEVERLVETRSLHVVDLLRDVVALTARLADVEISGTGPALPTVHRPRDRGRSTDPDWVTRRFREIELQIHDLQAALTSGVERGRRVGEGVADAGRSRLARLAGLPSPGLRRRDLIRRLQEVVDGSVPADATVLVVSRGDDALLDLGGRRTGHFPQADDGTYAGYHPADSEEAIGHLELLRARGAEYLVVPGPSLWWLDHYEGFGRHLERAYAAVAGDHESGLVFALATGPAPSGGSATMQTRGGPRAGVH